MVLRMPRTLILSLPKYSSAGATADLWWAAAASAFSVAADSFANAGVLAVVANATSETSARNRFTVSTFFFAANDGRIARP